MIDDFDDGLSDDEQDAAIREMHRVLEDDEIADYESDLVIYEHSQGIGF